MKFIPQLSLMLAAGVLLSACGGGSDHKSPPTPMPVNKVPVAQTASFATQADTQLSGKLMGTDADKDMLSFAVASMPSQGTLTLQSDGSFVYVPKADVIGMDQFTFSVSDGKASSMTAVVNITIDRLAVNFSSYTRAAFAQAAMDKPLPLNSRTVTQDVMDEHEFDDLLMP
jgi:VCBS repeat-containing protein